MDLFLVPANTKYLGDVIQYFSIQAKTCMVGNEKYVFFFRPREWVVGVCYDIYYNNEAIGKSTSDEMPSIEFDADKLWELDIISQVDPENE